MEPVGGQHFPCCRALSSTSDEHVAGAERHAELLDLPQKNVGVILVSVIPACKQVIGLEYGSPAFNSLILQLKNAILKL